MRRSDRTRGERDEGSVLPLVLVFLVIAGLIVVPLMQYSIAVHRANGVVADRTQQGEAAKAGLRVALGDPKNVFLECDNGGDLTAPGASTINGINVTTICTELEEIGPIQALNLEVPTGAVVMQLGAEVPPSFDGSAAQSAAAPPYPVSPNRADWWATPTAPDPDAQYSHSPETDKIWIPDLPRRPPNQRTSTPFTMPPGFGCSVFFPGYYPDPLTVPQGRVYFASGVYYFEDVVTIEGDSDVVVGYGLEDFAPASDCADDIQVSSNVVENPGSFDISGGGATWVFGGDGRLVIDNTATTTALSVRFNQRYDEPDRGGRISIMTVNGDDADPLDPADHDVTNVNRIPRSLVLDDDVRESLVGSGYIPSNSTHTDKARLPAEPGDFQVDDVQRQGTAVDRGVAVLAWDAVTGQAAGGALLGEHDDTGAWITLPYEVEYRKQSGGAWVPGCPAESQVTAPKPDPTDGSRVTCVIDGLDMNTSYSFRVRATNEVGPSAWLSQNSTAKPSSPVATAPDGPAAITVADSDRSDVAQVSWNDPLDDGGLPVTEYVATASSIELVAHPNAAPVTPPIGSERVVIAQDLLGGDSTVTAQLRVADPNGDDLALSVDASSLPAGMIVVADDLTDAVSVTVADITTAGADLSLSSPYVLPYEVTDPLGLVSTGELTIEVSPLAGITASPPVADALVLAADVGVPVTARIPASDADGLPLAATPITVDTSSLDLADWTVGVAGQDVTITTTAPDGTYSIPYAVTDASGAVANSTIEVTIARDVLDVGSCSVIADPSASLANSCEIENLVPLVAGTPTSGFQGYRVAVVATNAVGTSVPVTSVGPYPLSFGGTGVSLPTVVRTVEPWIPQRNVIDVIATGVKPVTVEVAGYVATPMGRIGIANPFGHAIEIKGGVMTGTFDVDDSRATGLPGSVPIGFKNDIVLQRKIRIVSTAGNVRSVAVVQVNEDGAAFAVNQWAVG